MLPHNQSMDRLFQSLLNLETLEECYAYFEDLCTVNEVVNMAQRLDTAILLRENQSYQNVMDKLDISTATIGRISRCLNYGSGGYDAAIEKLKLNEEPK